jgi:hypothetical protein
MSIENPQIGDAFQYKDEIDIVVGVRGSRIEVIEMRPYPGGSGLSSFVRYADLTYNFYKIAKDSYGNIWKQIELE